MQRGPRSNGAQVGPDKQGREEMSIANLVVQRQMTIACARQLLRRHQSGYIPGWRVPRPVQKVPTNSPLPSSVAALRLPLALRISKRRKTRSLMPGEGCTEKGIEMVGDLNMGLKAFPLRISISVEYVTRTRTLQPWCAAWSRRDSQGLKD